NEFDQLDANHANALIPALKAALRQASQTQFSNIHPAVEWRFRQEAERRSLGLPSEQIVFENVYPMYGLSDIRGSARERNRAIQEDLLAQFDLALAIVDAVIQYRPVAFLEQLRLDLTAYQERLTKGVSVEDEVSVIEYLRKHLELYFDFFRQCGDAAIQTVEDYEAACDNEQGCIYNARDRYDATIATINAALRQNWEKWQDRMQEILPHYCDTEVADGIDHILYVGASINAQFSLFHLHSLRYEQLRAICDAARVCRKLHEDKDIPFELCHLVLVQDTTVDIFHDEQTERLFDVQGTRDTRYEIVKKRIDKGLDSKEKTRITQPGMLTVVYSTNDEWQEYHQYLRYLVRERYVGSKIDSGTIESLQGITGLRFARVQILPEER
ncbi:MAG: GAF domain-containing protein, partial [Spirulinaceae cyanobacterium]